MKHFNVTGLCTPEHDYMADISGKLTQIKAMVDAGEYFTINRARQYGKTTILQALKDKLKDQYIVVKISFEGLGEQFFSEESRFCTGFDEIFGRGLSFSSATEADRNCWTQDINIPDNFLRLSQKITAFCKSRNTVLLIDEVDKASDNQTFLHFLGMLREKYLARKAGEDTTFTSVILAGVYDVKNIKLRMREKGFAAMQEGEGKYNSPWNIAANFKIDMSFSVSEISFMLSDYESEHHTGMDIARVALEIWNYTHGYPFLVSRICHEINEAALAWTDQGIQSAVKGILQEKNTLFDDIAHNLENNEDLRSFMYELLILGQEKHFERTNPTIDLAATFGFIRNEEGRAVIHNRMFELKITNYFISKNMENKEQPKISGVLAEDIIQNGQFHMEYLLDKFTQHYHELFENEKNRTFLEENGRLLFLTYLRPLLNEKGFYHIESQTTSERRMDIVVNYGTEQYILELKLWYGAKKHTDAYEQLYGYLESQHAEKGYLLTFDFRKKKHACHQWITYKGKQIYDVIV